MGMNDRQEIEQAVATYLDGFHEGDAGKLAAVFHPTCTLTQSLNGEIQILQREAWLEMVRGRPSPQSQGLSRADQVLAIEVVGPTLAHVKLRCAIPPRFFTDLLSLLKIDGRWKVARKVFMTEVRT
jgi:Putative lumazine-binding